MAENSSPRFFIGAGEGSRPRLSSRHGGTRSGHRLPRFAQSGVRLPQQLYPEIKTALFRAILISERVRGVEPLSWDWKSQVIPIYDTRIFGFVGAPRFELGLNAPKALVLPLHHAPP